MCSGLRPQVQPNPVLDKTRSPSGCGSVEPSPKRRRIRRAVSEQWAWGPRNVRRNHRAAEDAAAERAEEADFRHLLGTPVALEGHRLRQL
ncbi:hypothetical protein D910_03135 [Dendroctonus ponderosae]|uniref:Uncharacterized protein n=1 Tax=Dendroctonus ponderosae TaxID=77166 RepID=U4U6Y3_DENPD|nr:hypothetical protein D910_03135 [Dendroctonus ponderosae]